MVVVASELTWIASLLHDVKVFLKYPPTLLCESRNAFYLTTNPMLDARTKHIDRLSLLS